MGSPAPPNWRRLLKGKVLLQSRIQETLEAVRLCMNRCLLGGGRWDYQRMSRLLDAPELAAVLSEADPFKPSTEDKLEQVKNLLVAFEQLAPGLCYGGVHKAVLQIYLGCNWDWEGTNNLALEVLRLLLEGCTTTPAGLDPFDQDSLVGIAEALSDTVSDVIEAGMEAKYGAAVDHSLEALFSLSRYFGNPKAEAAKRRLWEPEVNLPGALIALAQQPLSAWGHDGRQDEEGVLERDEPLERYLSSCNNIVRVMGCLVQKGGPLDFGSTMKKHGELLQQPGIFAAFRELLQVGCDILYTCRYRELIGDGPQGKAAGAGMLRNIFAVVSHGATLAGSSAIAEWRDAGWGPVLQRIKSDRTYHGPYRNYFSQISSYLLDTLPTFQGTGADGFGGQAVLFGDQLVKLTLQLSQPAGSPATQRMDRPRDPSSLVENELRRRTGQVRGPDGQPVNTYEVQTMMRTYHKRCSKCGKDEAELAEAAAEAAASSSNAAAGSSAAACQGQQAAGGVRLRGCSACRRAHYCSRECQVAHWPEHKAQCKRYRKGLE